MSDGELTMGELAESVLAVARAQCCTCDPDVTVSRVIEGGGIIAQVAHDDWCPLLRASHAPIN